MKNISIIIPAFNEEKGISAVIKEIYKVDIKWPYEVVVVDDGSTDATGDVVRNLKKDVILLQHPYNRGYGSAIKTGIKKATGEYILIIDADGTYSPVEIPKLLKYAEDYDMVVGARMGEKVRIPLLRKPGKWLLSILANYLSGVKIPDLNSGLRIFKKKDVERFFNILPTKFSFTTTITLAYLSNDYTVKYVPIDYHERKGESKISVVRDGLYFILLIGRTIMFFNPLRVFLPVSLLLFGSGFLILLYQGLVLKNLGDLPVMLILASLQIGFLGLLADLIRHRK